MVFCGVANPIALARQSQRGFTLLELLLAMAIFALVAALAYSGLDSVLQSRQQIEQRMVALRELQWALLTLQRDLAQAATRSVRDNYGELERPLQGSERARAGIPELLTLTVAGQPDALPQMAPRSALQRVSYRLNSEQVLERYSWPVLDRAGDALPYRTPLLNGVAAVSLRYFDAQQGWQPSWPPPALGGVTSATTPPLPQAIAIELELTNRGKLSRILPLPALAAAAPTPTTR